MPAIKRPDRTRDHVLSGAATGLRRIPASRARRLRELSEPPRVSPSARRTAAAILAPFSVDGAVVATQDIEVLNDLIEATLDSAECYREAADRACARKFKELFAERAAERRHMVETLQDRVRALGGEPEGDGSLLAKAQRMLLDLKDSMTGKGDRAIIREVEAGEDCIKSRYEKILRQDLSPALRRVVADLYARIKADHDQISDLKHHPGRAATRA